MSNCSYEIACSIFMYIGNPRGGNRNVRDSSEGTSKMISVPSSGHEISPKI